MLVVYKKHLFKILHNTKPFWFLVVEEHEVMVTIYSVLINLHPIILFEVHWVFFKNHLDLSLIGDFKDNQARELGTYGF